MNEILFRGKGKNGWVEGGYHKHFTRMLCPLGNDSLKDNEIRHLIIRDGVADWNMPRGIEAVEVDPKTVGQFTGLTDKNGKKIFEGDYVRMRSGTVRLVVFTHGSFGYFCSDEIVDFMPFAELFKLGYTSDDFEVAGNMFDNPEMNKKEEKNETNGR
jgi:uncharacterized phage protein (TIGR01671 family)